MSVQAVQGALEAYRGAYQQLIAMCKVRVFPRHRGFDAPLGKEDKFASTSAWGIGRHEMHCHASADLQVDRAVRKTARVVRQKTGQVACKGAAEATVCTSVNMWTTGTLRYLTAGYR